MVGCCVGIHVYVLSMAKGSSYENYQEELNFWWDSLLQKPLDDDNDEMEYFYHCTFKNSMGKIKGSGILEGHFTDIPTKAPLTVCKVKGVWMALSPKKRPTKSPYGTQRLLVKTSDLIGLLTTRWAVGEGSLVDEDDSWDADDDTIDKRKGKAGKQSSKDKKRKDKQKRQQKKQYLKPKYQQPEEPMCKLPLLFFECAHHFDSIQYIRLVLVRSQDEQVIWCKDHLKEIDLEDNPFFKYNRESQKVYSRCKSKGKVVVIVEIFIVGDINLNMLPTAPEWDEVGTLSRASGDPEMGVNNGNSRWW